ncbi:MAG: thioredoxin-disulfide reductase [Candidatus Lambdaproteobacteria bacterium]|nr:thioredoxin-disulfide reductase [Candidatus Lambdaproteobacteria bacterium]
MYTKTVCAYCDRAKALLGRKGVTWTEINLDLHPERREEMIERSEGRRTVPQIFVDGKGLGGSDDIHGLERQGKLDRILGLGGHTVAAPEHHRVLILGSGPAGLTAAIYAARANLKPAVVNGIEPGGQLTITTEVENYPGYPEGVQGPQMMADLNKQAERFGTTYLNGTAVDVELSKRPFVVKLDGGEVVSCDALIVATGASAKWLGIESETRFRNKGVSACATCDGFFFKGKPLAVIGGGDTALEEALYLTNFATRVTLIHRRDQLRASQYMQQRAIKNPKIEFLWDTTVEEVVGTPHDGVTGLKVKNVKTNATSTLAVKGMFVAIGHEPNTQVFKGKLEMNDLGYLVVQPGRTYTSVEGVFAAGDAADHIYRQAVTAAGTGCMAAMDAERWLAEHAG